jgi:hypothetical protein
MTDKIIHLARNPGHPVLVTWCGFSQAKESEKYMRDLKKMHDKYASETNVRAMTQSKQPIVTSGFWNCFACNANLRAEARRIACILYVLPKEEHLVLEGCGDSSCVIRNQGGMATNGGCRCELHELREGVRQWKQHALRLESLLVSKVKKIKVNK